jgi:hypothetical protein
MAAMPLRHWAVPVFAFAAVTAWWLFPVLSNLSGVIPGVGAGDNVTFVWNVWWMRYVLLHPGQTFFFTPFLFHPVGVDLTLHTHTALPALVGAAWVSPIAGQNAVIVLHVYLNFLCAYALAYRLTRNVVSSFAAAVIFGTSAFVTAHLNGHFNLIAGWTLPLVCLLTWNARDRPSWTRGVLVGMALAATAYTDYYLFVYAVVIVLLFWVSAIVRLRLKTEPYTSAAPKSGASFRSRVLAGLFALLLLDAIVIALILVFPGDRLDLGPIHLSLRSVRNPITLAWMLMLVAAVLVASARVRLITNPDANANRSTFIAAIGTMVVLLLPLLVHAAVLWRSGGYVSHAYFWRSGPAGIDVATIVLGNPFHVVWGDSVRGLYERFHIDAMESSGWLPVSAVVLAIAGIVLRSGEHNVPPLALAGIIFMTWALGPWLTMFGRQTPLILPGILLRYVPIVANARVPGRAIVVVYVALATLAAIGLQQLVKRGRAGRIATSVLFVILVIECLPARPPLYVPDMPSNFFALRDAPKRGAVCELPLGLRDGFGESGSLDEAVLLHQTIHERPIVGGFVARLQPSIRRSYESAPVVGSLLRLSSGGKLSGVDTVLTPREATAALTAAGIAFIVLDTRRASTDLVDFVHSRIELRQIGEQHGRVFYEVVEN